MTPRPGGHTVGGPPSYGKERVMSKDKQGRETKKPKKGAKVAAPAPVSRPIAPSTPKD